MTICYRLGLSDTVLQDLSSEQKFNVLQQFCTIYRIPELCEVIDGQFYMFYYGEDSTITWMPYDDYFGEDLSRYVLENYQEWCGSMPYGFFPDINATIFIPFWEEDYKPRYVTPIDMPDTPLVGLNACGLDYLVASTDEYIKQVDELYDLYDCTKEDYLEIHSSLARMCKLADNYCMCLYAR
jgi:hypothetical protein